MDRNLLLASASRLIQPSTGAAREFEAARDALAAELSRRMEARPDLDKLIGAGNLPMMQDNSRNFCRFMASQFVVYEPRVLVETALWVFRAYRAHGFATTYWAANLDTFLAIAEATLPPSAFLEVVPFFDWLIVNIPVFVAISDREMQQPLGDEPTHI